MVRQSLTTAIFISCAAAIVNGASAADQLQTQQRTQIQQEQQMREQIYGSQLMTSQERNEYRNRMRTAKTEQERERIRSEHHARMQERAKEKGVTLPDNPPPRGGGMGSGGGMGPGGGMGGRRGGSR